MPNPTPTLIDRAKVLEAIDERYKHWQKWYPNAEPAHTVLQEVKFLINGLPAAPADSTPAPQPADFGPCVVCGRSVLDPHWGIVHSGCAAQFRNPQPAPQPALDVAGLVAGTQGFLDAWNADSGTVSLNAAKSVVERVLSALTTLAARLAEVERERDEALTWTTTYTNMDVYRRCLAAAITRAEQAEAAFVKLVHLYESEQDGDFCRPDWVRRVLEEKQ